MLTGLSQLNIETNSTCDKEHLCIFCGHQNPKINPGLKLGVMPLDLLYKVREQIPIGVVVQWHRDGDPLAYPYLEDSIMLFRDHITSIVTHGMNLMKKAHHIIDNVTSLTVSAFRGDPDGPEQAEILYDFMQLKEDRPPIVNVKIVGKMPPDEEMEYAATGATIIRRVAHVPKGDFKYAHRNPTIPEVGVCLDFLNHPSIDWQGNVFICNRLDPNKQGLLGNLNNESLDSIWNGPKRQEWLKAHLRGRRDQASELCRDCLMYGVPTEP